jgi:hypothetical protein
VLDVPVKRSQWYRGQGPEGSALLRDDGTMCCVGFACIAAGLTEEQIRNIGTVEALLWNGFGAKKRLERVPKALKSLAGPTAHNLPHTAVKATQQLYAVNDTSRMSDPEREAEIYQLGQQLNLNFTFVD